MRFTEHIINNAEEKHIITGMIVSTEFCKRISEYIDLDYFKNSYIKTLAEWALIFYQEHSKSPFLHINDIFESNRKSIKDADAELIDDLLSILGKQYIGNDVNVDFLMDEAENYFRKRELEIHVNNISVLSEKDDIEGAEKEIERFNKISIKLDESIYINPGDADQRENLYRKREIEQKEFFQLPGDLGLFLGNFAREDVIGITAPAKRGKCKCGSSLIYMPDGTLKRLDKIVKDRDPYVLSMNDDLQIIEGKVEDWIVSGKKQIFEVITKSGCRDKSSKDHKYFTPSGWKKLSELKIGDCVAMSRSIPNTSDISLPDYHSKLVAYLIADGHLKEKYIEFTKFNKEIMDDFISCVESFGDNWRYGSSGKSLIVRRGNILSLLKEYDLLGRLSGGKFIPDTILKCDNHTISTFLKTLFTCDGSIWLDRESVQIEYSSKSEYLISQIQMCLQRFSIFSKVCRKRIDGEFYYLLTLSSNKNIQLFMDNIGFDFHKQEKAQELCANLVVKRDYIDIIPKEFVHEAGLELQAKCISFSNNETFREAFAKGTHLSRFTFSKVMGDDHKYVSNDILWDRIVRIKKKHSVMMYDLSIKDNHNFISNSFIVHNSFLLTTINKHAILSNIQTLKFSIEMTDTQEITRFDKAFYPSVEDEGHYLYPEFDCLKNQMSNCGDRLSTVIVKEDEKAAVVQNPNHITCTKCKDDRNEYKRYEPTVYKKEIWRPENTHFNVKKAMKPWLPVFNKYSRIVVRPKYSLTYDLMMRDIDIMATRYNFIPRIILMDYIDILGITSQFDDYRLVDEAWKLLQKVAGRTKCLIVSPTQADKEGHKTELLDTTNQAGFYGKSRHVNMMWGINQTPIEKMQGLFRLSVLDSRSSYQSKLDFCTVLQDLGAGQMYIDSYWKNKFNYSGKVR